MVVSLYGTHPMPVFLVAPRRAVMVVVVVVFVFAVVVVVDAKAVRGVMQR